MRFSAVFQLPLRRALRRRSPRPCAWRKPAAPALPVSQAPSFADLPEDLDQRVRMVGEWQLGEG
jgi:hypothetical protein